MPGWGIDATLAIALTGISGYFVVLNARVLHRYLRFRAMRGAALLVWPAPRPSARALGVALGVVSVPLTIAGVALRAPLLTLSQGLTALYFLGAVPLVLTIRPGFYVSGIWADAGFVPYGQIARWAFHDSEETVLLIVRRGHARALRLSVPRDDYGAVSKLLQQKAHEHALRVDPQILDLSSP
jgi:hypothetical protein